MGIGPSAHSFNGEFRQHNIPNMFSYLKLLSENKLNTEVENLSFIEKFNEKIMIGLRLREGIGLRDIQSYIDDKIDKHFNKTLQKHIENNNIVINNDNFALTNQGKLLADNIIQDFFVV